MAKLYAQFVGVLVSSLLIAACSSDSESPSTKTANTETPTAKQAPPEEVPADPKNIVSIASASKDHTTLVTALQAADYVRAVSNPGPLTVFAPTNAAFDKLPPGTVDSLLKPENVDQLKNILKYHVTTSVYEAKDLKDGLVLGMANLKKVKIRIVDGKVTVNDANVVASIRGTNGAVHVIDGVLLPPK